MGELILSIDVEDVRDWVDNGQEYTERVPANMERYLEFLKKHNANATFFIVGQIARSYPSLISDIVSEGHEIACHTDTHIQLDRQNRQSLRDDLTRNIDSLMAAGATEIIGFRAPTFSLIESTRWAYEVLQDLGFKYSSSVMPARNPIFGWPSFGRDFKKVTETLWELPITLYPPPLPPIPVAGGVYFRVMPFPLLRYAVKKLTKKNIPVQSYLHPYDIDSKQERFMHPALNNSKIYNRLMYVNRSKVFTRLENLLSLCSFTTYREYITNQLDV